ncbi:MAG: cell wall-binding repeat-containing protein [Actinobacteria bacterium]|nr:cell wall-binding repeat-containing protein [Actinomycetota bacterium]
MSVQRGIGRRLAIAGVALAGLLASSPGNAALPEASRSGPTSQLEARLSVVILDGKSDASGGAARTEQQNWLSIGDQRVPVPAALAKGLHTGSVAATISGAVGSRPGDIAQALRSGAARVTHLKQAPGATVQRTTLGTHEVTVVPVSWAGSEPAVTADDIKIPMDFADRFWNGNTDNQIDLSVNSIHPTTPITLTQEQIRTCDNFAVEAAVRKKYPDIVVDEAHHLAIVTPYWSDCWWGGMAMFDSGLLWINGFMSGSVWAHEFGHNFGLAHEGSLTCYAKATRQRVVSLSKICDGQVYDDPWDVMGNRATGALTASSRVRLGTIPSSALRFVSGNETITLAPVAAKDGIRSVVLQVDNAYYEIEYRTPSGWDDWIDDQTFTYGNGQLTMPGGGVVVRYVQGFGLDNYNDRFVVNFHPQTPKNYEVHPGLEPGESYTFPWDDLKMTVESASADGARVRFSRGGDDGVQRWAGSDRYAASATISRFGLPENSGKVFLASGEIFTDALSGAGVAGAAKSPLLLTQRDRLRSSVSQELDRRFSFATTVLGGPASISADLASILIGFGPVTRLSGADRYETSAAISQKSFAPGVDRAYVASGVVFPDALSGAPVAGKQKAPMLLTKTDSLPPSIAAELKRLRPKGVVILGGTASVTAAVEAQLAAASGAPVSRLAGADRYAVSALVSQRNFAAGADTVFVASGAIYTDALSGAPVAAAKGSPLLLVKGTSIPEPIAAELTRLAPKSIVILGGPNSVSTGVEAALAAYVRK